jgi:hypothetical protein
LEVIFEDYEFEGNKQFYAFVWGLINQE